VPRNAEVERAAETHYFIRPLLLRALEQQALTDAARQHWNTQAVNWRERWTEQFSDRWFDMTTVVRLGTALETGLRDAYGRLSQVGAPPAGRGVFQRLVDDTDIAAAFVNDCGGLDLRAYTEWMTIREVMLHRHLYAHRAGEVDEKYIDDHIRLTGTDIRPQLAREGYPAQAVYWFAPLKRIPEFIESTRRFFGGMP
jgi:hypothetical protein